ALAGACGLRLVWIATLFQIPKYHTFTHLFLSYPVSWAVTTVVLTVAYFIIRGKYPKSDTALA
ncbi:MAG TPA: MATE family efflux transporter, partial [Alphaproteobacteria bacterium]|nr:MATE family efflux transporter [Alphaproteobacteria bacterium]